MSVYPKVNMDIEGLCIDNCDGKSVLVIINPKDEKCQVQFEVKGAFGYMELTPESISTIVV